MVYSIIIEAEVNAAVVMVDVESTDINLMVQSLLFLLFLFVQCDFVFDWFQLTILKCNIKTNFSHFSSIVATFKILLGPKNILNVLSCHVKA